MAGNGVGYADRHPVGVASPLLCPFPFLGFSRAIRPRKAKLAHE